MKNKITRRQFIDKSLKSATLLGACGSFFLIKGCDDIKEYDLVISGGIVYDGLGNPGRELDIAVRVGKIVSIAKNINTKKARQVIKAAGFAVSPGFIDAHTHTDTELIANPKAESYIRQGITTEISGNCGSSPFPIADVIFEQSKKRFKEEHDVDLDWNNINGFFRRLEVQGIALNYASLVGFGSIRGKVVGYNDQPATEIQIAEMKRLVEENLLAGAIGFSTGLEYTPDSYARTDEIIQICHSVSKHNGVYATHMRDEGDYLLEAIDEALTIARETNISLQISHLKTAFPRNWNKINDVLAKIEDAKKNGIKILFDRYPYIAASTGLDILFPNWIKQGTTEEFIARLKDPCLDKQLRSHSDQVEKKYGSWEKIVLSSVYSEKNKKFEGKNIVEAANQTGKNPYDFIRDLLIEEMNRVEIVEFILDENNLKKIISHSLWIAGSDGAAVAPYGKLSAGKPHPRFYGTFPRILGKYVREEKVLTLPSAIQKLTSTTATKFGLLKRGQITSDYYADIVIFNPETIIDRATFDNPHQYPEGVEYVVVNGEVVVQEGEHTGLLPGKILRKS